MCAALPLSICFSIILLLQQQLQALSDHVCITASEPSVNHLVANAGAWSISFDEITTITAFTKMMVSQSSALLMHRSKIYKMRCE